MMCSDTFQKVVQLRHFVEPASYYTMHLAYFGCGHLILTFSYDLQASITIWPFLYNTLAILHGCTIWLQYFVSSVEAAIFQSYGCAYLHAAFSHFSFLPSTVQSAPGKEFLGTPIRKWCYAQLLGIAFSDNCCFKAGENSRSLGTVSKIEITKL